MGFRDTIRLSAANLFIYLYSPGFSATPQTLRESPYAAQKIVHIPSKAHCFADDSFVDWSRHGTGVWWHSQKPPTHIYNSTFTEKFTTSTSASSASYRVCVYVDDVRVQSLAHDRHCAAHHQVQVHVHAHTAPTHTPESPTYILCRLSGNCFTVLWASRAGARPKLCSYLHRATCE